jgi:DNA-binding NtrC family response regulator
MKLMDNNAPVPNALPSDAPMRGFIGRVLPGKSQSILHLRQNILDFCASPTARFILIEGPIGSGKSTIARVIAALKRVAPLRHKMSMEILNSLRFTGANLIDLNALPWYVELPLTGLAPELAEAQLFGSAKHAYTGAVDRAGVFESAMRGRRKRGEKVPEGAALTRGVVFLDEIGDLSSAHQAKLLPVLSGGAFYRLGEEGDDGKEMVFQGAVIAATWKTLASSMFRPDLLSRIATNRLTVPSLAERMDDFPEILASVEHAACERIIKAIQDIVIADPEADRDYWEGRRKALPTLTDQDRAALAEVDWSAHGNLRGLTMAVDLMIDRGISARDAIPMLRPIETPDRPSRLDTSQAMVRALLNRGSNGKGLQAHIRAVEREFRGLFQQRLKLDRALQSQLALRLGIEQAEFTRAVGELDRDRSTHG